MSTLTRDPGDIGPVLGKAASRYISACDYSANADYIIFVDELLSRTRCSDARSVVEIGSGPGTLCSLVKAVVPTAVVTGIDASAEMVAHARSTYPQVNFTLDTAERLPFKSNSIDCLISLNTLHHLSSLSAAIQEFLRVLRPNGCAYLGDLRRDAPRRAVGAKLNRMHAGLRQDFLRSLKSSFNPSDVSNTLKMLGVPKEHYDIWLGSQVEFTPSTSFNDPFHHERDIDLSMRVRIYKHLM
jgi:ubiquinone/menaquinone biosynthesis C-methylase UbiE